MQKIDVSILMPVFNVEKYIERSIKSIVNQTFKNWELIIVNDGSTDNSGKICDEIAKEDKRIKVIHKKNTGVSDTRNILLDNAKGRYLGFVDSDDFVEDNMFEILINNISKYNSDLSVCGIVEEKIIDNKIVSTLERSFNPVPYIKIEDMNDLIMDYANSGLLNSLCNKLYKTNIIRDSNIRFSEEFQNGEDLIFNLKYMTQINSLTFLDEKPYHYARRQNNSITNSYIEDMYYNGLKIHKIIEDFLKDMNFFTEKNQRILAGNHLIGVFSDFLNLFHKDCNKTFAEKNKHINKIINREYVKECSEKLKKDKSIKGIMSLLIRIKSSILIIICFKLLANVRDIRSGK